MARFTYTGDEPQHYPQYLDVGGGESGALVAEPGGTYDIRQVEGLTVPGEPDEDGNPTVVEVKLAMPPDDRWTPEKTTKARPVRAETSEES